MDLTVPNLTPRLASSRQWTSLPRELLLNLQTVFKNQFKAEAIHGQFVVEGRIYPEELVMRVGYLEMGRLKQTNFEASMDIVRGGDDEESVTMERVYTCIDALGSLMEEFMKAGPDGELEMDVPERWGESTFEDEVVYLQQSTVNSSLEAEADRLLGLADKKLFNEADENEDALGNAEIDSELAEAVQKLIREGKHPMQAPQKPDPENEN